MNYNKNQNLIVFFSFLFIISDLSIDAPPPFYPPKKYCDVTGFEVKKFFYKNNKSLLDQIQG